MTAAAAAAWLPPAHAPHPLHDAGRDWPETNCYVDVWIELLGALGLTVEACLGFPLASEFEGDQWTFFKPPHADLEELYGLRVEELTLWRPLAEQMREQVERGRVPLVEVDSFHLPDTCGSAYREHHEKTTIAIVGIDLARQRLRYFHNRGLHELGADDFAPLLRVGEARGSAALPPYCEIVKTGALLRRDDATLRERSLALLHRHFARRPHANPVRAYEAAFEAHVAHVVASDPAVYHAYAFASVRQLGAGAELLASHLRWLDGAFAPAADAFAELSSAAKTFLLKLARIAHARRARDVSSSFDDMAGAWERGMDALAGTLAR